MSQVIYHGRQLYFASGVFLALFATLALIGDGDSRIRWGCFAIAIIGLVSLVPHIIYPRAVLKLRDDDITINYLSRGRPCSTCHPRDSIDRIELRRLWLPGGDGYQWVMCMDVLTTDGFVHEYDLPPLLSVSIHELRQMLIAFTQRRYDKR
jgi:hypothetical protein